MCPTGILAPQFCCSILCQEILLLWDKIVSFTNSFALKVEGLILDGAQRCNLLFAT